jgi:hypothetical protein
MKWEEEWNEFEQDWYDSDPAWDFEPELEEEEVEDEQYSLLLDDASDPAEDLIAQDPEAFKMFATDFNLIPEEG